METKVLVAYGTKYGATAGIAEKIGQTLKEKGLPVDVLSVDQVKDLGSYRAVVLGSAVYMGMWRKEAAALLKNNVKTLATKPVWFFSSGPTAKGDAAVLMKGWTFPKNLQPIADNIKPNGIAVFGGVANFQKMNFFERFVLKRMKVMDGDYRDLNMIAAWANKIADELKK